MELYKCLKKVNTKEDFINYLEKLSNDNQYNNQDWENKSIRDYLDSIKSWIEDSDGYYANENSNIPKDVDWGFIAQLFYVGKIYE